MRALVRLGGPTLLTDPMFSERASPLSFAGPKRHVAPGLALGELPHVDLVLVSHNHYDHLDAPSVEALVAQGGGAPLFIVPLGPKSWLGKRGVANAVELDWWETHRLPSATRGVAKRSLGVHWGTFELTDEALDEPPRALAREARDAGLGDGEFFVLRWGRRGGSCDVDGACRTTSGMAIAARCHPTDPTKDPS